MNFGERLRHLRNKHNMTQQDLADKIGVRRATIAGYETKGKEPPYITLRKLSQALNCSIDYLLGNLDGECDDNIFNEADLAYYTKVFQRDDLKKLIDCTKSLDSSSVNRIINIVNIINEEVAERISKYKSNPPYNQHNQK